MHLLTVAMMGLISTTYAMPSTPASHAKPPPANQRTEADMLGQFFGDSIDWTDPSTILTVGTVVAAGTGLKYVSDLKAKLLYCLNVAKAADAWFPREERLESCCRAMKLRPLLCRPLAPKGYLAGTAEGFWREPPRTNTKNEESSKVEDDERKSEPDRPPPPEQFSVLKPLLDTIGRVARAGNGQHQGLPLGVALSFPNRLPVPLP
ncbi:MAG: hypothetical protein M1816_000213 [Peltula sp. TS41687]|nr:MAG: hypothetical protein M1816_000213 [Peltula sp. TS41687]